MVRARITVMPMTRRDIVSIRGAARDTGRTSTQGEAMDLEENQRQNECDGELAADHEKVTYSISRSFALSPAPCSIRLKRTRRDVLCCKMSG